MGLTSASTTSKTIPKGSTKYILLNPNTNHCSSDNNLPQVVAHIKTLNRKAVGIVADVSQRSEVETLVQNSVDALGPLDVMVANAGIAQVKPVLELTEQDVERMFSVNLFGVFNCYQVAAKQMIKQGTKGKLIGAAR